MSEKLQSKEIAPEVLPYREGVIGLLMSDLLTVDQISEILYQGEMPDEIAFLKKLPAAEQQIICEHLVSNARRHLLETPDGELPNSAEENLLLMSSVLGFCPADVRIIYAEKKLKWALAESQDELSGYSTEQEVASLAKCGIVSEEQALQLETKILAGAMLSAD